MVLALGLLNQSLLAYFLLPEGRGAYAVCVIFASLSGVIVTPGSDRGTQYFVMARQITVSQGMSIAFAICFIGSVIAVGAAIPLIRSDFRVFSNADPISFYLALIMIPTSALTIAVQLQLEGLRRFVRLGFYFLLRSLLVVAGLVTLVWGLGLGVDGAIISLVLGHLLMIMLVVLYLHRHYGLRVELPTRDGFRQVIGYGLKDYVAKVGYAIDYRIGGLLLSMVGGRAEIGLLTAGSALITQALTIPDAVATSLLPRAAGDDRGRPELAAFCARCTWWITGGVLLAWFAVSTPLVDLVLSEAFAAVAPLTRIMSIGIFAYAGAEIFVAYFRGTNRPRVCSWAMWLGLSANVVLFFILYPMLSLEGAAWAMTGGLVCRSLFLGFMFHRAARLPVLSSLIIRPADISYLWASGRNLIDRKATR